MAAKTASIRALAPLNLFLADVRDGVGPYLAIYLLTVRHWSVGSIGVAMALPGLVAVLLQTPAGSLVDSSRHKRLLLLLASAVVGVCCVAAVTFRAPAVIYLTQGLIGAATTLYAPVVAAITLGLVGHRLFARQTGRNEAWNYGGNVLAAVLAGLIGYYWRYEGIFFLVALMCVLGSGAALSTILSGYLIEHFGYRVGFLALAAVAVAAQGFFWTFVAETNPASSELQPAQ